jgi:hypothetical protein
MRKRLTLAFVAAIAIAAAVTAGALAQGIKPVVVRAGNLIVTLNGWATPKALPKDRDAPVALHATGHIATADGSHPPALKTVLVDIAKKGETGKIRAQAFPTCRATEIEATDTATAKAKCKDAIVGSGTTKAEVAFPEQAPFTASGPLVVFNGGVKNGKTLILIHAYVNVPAPTAIVTRVTSTEGWKDGYRLHAIAEIPLVAGGAGSPIDFALKIDRKGYLTASCGTGAVRARAKAIFRDGSELSGNFVRPCTGH